MSTLPTTTSTLRDAPTTSAMPSIVRFLPTRFAKRGSLRPAVMMISFFGAIYALFAAAAILRRRNDQDTSTKLDTMYLILAILYFVAAGFEFFGFAALVKTYFFASVVIAFVVTGAEITRTVIHVIDKSSVISACIAGETLSDPDTTDAAYIASWCRSQWNRNLYWDIGLFIFSSIAAFLFASVVGSYLQQLLNPALTRQHVVQTTPAVYAYPIQTGTSSYPPNPYGASMPPPNYQPGYVLPTYDPAGYVLPGGPEKDHQFPQHQQQQNQNQNPFTDSAALSRRPGETTQEFEQRQHDRDQALESTDTVRLEPRNEERRI